ncbi:MAG: DUF4129 domain-containing protein [Anaerolineae bacterium]|nr:DUF4129 domain-containing protein [Gloeobacterales cyanobacterium ES-bin-313]
MADSFDKTSVGWAIQQLQQRLAEWLEGAFAKNPVDVPNLEWLAPIILILFWLLLGAFGLWLLWQIALVLQPALQERRRTPLTGTTTDEESISTYSAAAYLKQAQAFQKQGKYREAARALYLAMLQTLNDKQVVLEQLSRTDGEYRQLIQPLSQAPAYQLLIDTHEQILFDETQTTAQTVEQLQQAYQEIAKP